MSTADHEEYVDGYGDDALECAVCGMGDRDCICTPAPPRRTGRPEVEVAVRRAPR